MLYAPTRKAFCRAIAAKREGGFSLIELLVALAIIAVIAGLIVSAYKGVNNSAVVVAQQKDTAELNQVMGMLHASGGNIAAIINDGTSAAQQAGELTYLLQQSIVTANSKTQYGTVGGNALPATENIIPYPYPYMTVPDDGRNRILFSSTGVPSIVNSTPSGKTTFIAVNTTNSKDWTQFKSNTIVNLNPFNYGNLINTTITAAATPGTNAATGATNVGTKYANSNSYVWDEDPSVAGGAGVPAQQINTPQMPTPVNVSVAYAYGNQNPIPGAFSYSDYMSLPSSPNGSVYLFAYFTDSSGNPTNTPPIAGNMLSSFSAQFSNTAAAHTLYMQGNSPKDAKAAASGAGSVAISSSSLPTGQYFTQGQPSNLTVPSMGGGSGTPVNGLLLTVPLESVLPAESRLSIGNVNIPPQPLLVTATVNPAYANTINPTPINQQIPISAASITTDINQTGLPAVGAAPITFGTPLSVGPAASYPPAAVNFGIQLEDSGGNWHSPSGTTLNDTLDSVELTEGTGSTWAGTDDYDRPPEAVNFGLSQTTYTYTGSAIQPGNVTCSDPGAIATCTFGGDTSKTDIGSYSIIITADGINYTGTSTISWSIVSPLSP